MGKRLPKNLTDNNNDGCTIVPDFNFTSCCVEHDFYYGNHHDYEGNPISRSEADKRLKECISKQKGPIGYKWAVTPWIYWLGVRAFGGLLWNSDKNKAKAKEISDYVKKNMPEKTEKDMFGTAEVAIGLAVQGTAKLFVNEIKKKFK